jgi:hypothetical protein
LGWLGDGESDVEDQPTVLAQFTFTYLSGNRIDKQTVTNLFAQALGDLEAGGNARAASPYQLTSRGRAARLTGLSTGSVRRLELAIERGRRGWLSDLSDVSEISSELSEQMARIVFESTEVFSNSLWLRRTSRSRDSEELRLLRAFGEQLSNEHHGSEEFNADIQLLSGWILGRSYRELAMDAPIYDNANSLFGGTQDHKRTSDATEYIGKITYPSAWTWSALQVLLEADDLLVPGFLRDSLEYGLPYESATMLVRRGRLTRAGAMQVIEIAGSNSDDIRDWLSNEDELIRWDNRFTRLDAKRLRDLHEATLAE